MAQPPRPRTGRRLFGAVALLACLLVSPAAPAGTIASPTWSDLTAEQHGILAPLASDWNTMEFWRRSKWLEIAQRYPAMSPEEQQRMQDRMRAWAKLTPEERKAARHIFKNVQKATPEQRDALKQMWAEYEALPEAEKERLKQQAAQAPKAPGGRHPAGSSKPMPKLPVPPPASPTGATR